MWYNGPDFIFLTLFKLFIFSIIEESVEENLTDIATKSIREAKNALLMERYY